MRRIVFVLVLLFATTITIVAKNRCLLIGIGHYPEHSGWNDISSTNDVKLLEEILKHSFSVVSLTDNEATHTGIITAINNLTVNVAEGDTILIHFSCHGQQVLTSDNDEPDGLDEALVPFDALSTKSESYSGENHLLDNELGKLITQLRNRAGKTGLVVITLDACFSDSMNKGKSSDQGEVIYRGGADIFGSNTISPDSLMIIENKRKEHDEYEIEVIPNGANVVILSACQSYQKNMEIKRDGLGYGSLSYAMFLSFNSKGFGDINEWLNEVIGQMSNIAYTQTPQIRTTLKWEKDIGVINPIPENNHNNSIILYVLSGFLLIITFIGIVIWKKKK